MAAVSMWPRVVVSSGPEQAGIRAGDAFPLAPDHWLFLSAPYWTDDRLVLSVFSTRDGLTNGHAWRFAADTRRFESINYGGNSSSGAKWGPVDSAVVKLGGHPTSSAKEQWTLDLVEDGPAVTTTRRFGTFSCVNPVSKGSERDGSVSSSWTLLQGDGTLGALEVYETRDGKVGWQRKPRFAGASLFFPSGDFRRLDKEIARGIIAQMHDKQPSSWIDFDGSVHHWDPGGSAHGMLSGLFWELTRGRYPKTDDEKAACADEIATTRAASRDEIAAVVRALLPVDWAREQQLREECATLPR